MFVYADSSTYCPSERKLTAPLFLKQDIGRVAMLSSALSLLWSVHFLLFAQLSLHFMGLLPFGIAEFVDNHRLWLLWQWTAYFSSLCLFHMLEFWTTALFNPSEASADSFLVNHSTAYTAAALISWTEFTIRFLFMPRWRFFLPPCVSIAGYGIAVVAQVVRSLAMITAGQSFNHTIQTRKRSSHLLVTHGIYRYLRHPSYVGFFYWSIATQLVLGNCISTIGYSVTAWNFFHRRIAFEEESLHNFFQNEYSAYAKRTIIGIPFLRSAEYGRCRQGS